MRFKTVLLASAAALMTITTAKAADVVVAEPEPVEYVRVCDAYGAGYFYIPGTETCMRLSGYVRADIKAGDKADARKAGDVDQDTYRWRTRATLRFHTASETELGTLRTFIELRSQWDDGSDTADGQLRFGYIELGGLRVGLDESIFSHWTGYYGNVLNDDVVNPMNTQRTNVISYTFNNGSGFSAILGVEQGNNAGDDGKTGYDYYRNDLGGISAHTKVLSSGIDDYTPNILMGLKYAQGWGKISAVGAYDAYNEEWAGKVRLDLNVTDQFSVWVMGGYKSVDDYYASDSTAYRLPDGTRSASKTENGITRRGVYRLIQTNYGDWGGDWSVWGGATYKFTKKASFNTQLSYDDTSTFAASVNIKYDLVPGLTITPELTYVSWDDDYKVRNDAGTTVYQSSMKGKDAFQGMVRLQRSF
ncbi:porin [Bartonella sp. LJL80]